MPLCIFLHTTGTSQMPTMMLTVMTMEMVTYWVAVSGHPPEGETHGIFGVRRRNGFIGQRTHHTQPQPWQRQAEVLCKCNDADDNGNRRRDGEHPAVTAVF